MQAAGPNGTGADGEGCMRRWLGGLCALLACIAVLASSVAIASPRLVSMQPFTRAQGLGNLAAHVMLLDHRGVLWVGTDRGLFRFDGSHFVAVPFAPDGRAPQINDLYQARDGRLWIGTPRHVYAWNRGHPKRMADLPVTDLQRMAGDGAGGIYVRHQHRLWHIAGGAVRAVPWTRALAVGALTDGPLLHTGDGLWTTCGSALCLSTPQGTRVWGVRDGVPADHWNIFRAAADGGLWVGGDHHLLHLAPGADHFRVTPSADPIDAIALDHQGRVLVARGGHIGRWDGHAWQDFSDDQGLQSAQLRDLAVAPSGAVWVSTEGRGVLRWRGYGQFSNWQRAQGLDSAPTWAIARDADGTLWLGNQRHGNLLKPGAQRLQPWPRALRRHDWTDAIALLPRGRRMWILFNRGSVARYDLDSHRAVSVARDLGWAKFALFDARGRFWFGTHGALFRIDDPAAPHPAVRRLSTGLPGDTNYLGACRGADGGIWLATSHGLLHFAQGRFQRIRPRGTLPAGGLVDVARTADGRLWLASMAQGLYWIRDDGSRSPQLHAVADTLLRRTTLYSLDVDRAGRLWAASDAGVDVRIGARWRRLDRDDGLVWNDLSAGAFLSDADGTVWLGTSGGVSHLLHPDRLGAVHTAAPVLLRASYGGQPVPMQGGIAVPWSGDALTVEMAATGLTHAGVSRLRYRLLGDDGDSAWETSESGTVRYAALAPGRYRFQAQWTDPYLRQRSKPVTLALQVAPPWWRTDWARSVYALLALAALVVVWRWRHAHLLRRQGRLEQLVAERTRELEAEKHALEAARRALQHEASHDALTGLLNRGALVEHLVEAIVDSQQAQRPLAVALLDLDHFKRINDTHGHLAGDAVLVQCASRLRALVPEQAVLGRYGGEELVVLWPGLPGDTDLDTLFAPVIDAEYRDGPTRLRVTSSVGVAWARRDDDVGTLLRRADAALYRAKRSGRARVERVD